MIIKPIRVILSVFPEENAIILKKIFFFFALSGKKMYINNNTNMP